MDQKNFNEVLGKLMLAVFMVGLLIGAMMYLNGRWSKIRDMRRLVDSRNIIKALQIFYMQYGDYPDGVVDDANGWDNSNDAGQGSFLKTVVDNGVLSGQPFDPKNDQDYYYRYQRFPAGAFGCLRPFAVFQVMRFEKESFELGAGECAKMDFTKLAPLGYTWQDFE